MSVGGNGSSTCEESNTHFTTWALMKSPLLIGTDVRIKPLGSACLDPVIGTSVSPHRWGPDYINNDTHPAWYRSGESHNGTVFMLINTLGEAATISFNLTEPPWIRVARQYSVRVGRFLRFLSEKLSPSQTKLRRAWCLHSVVALLLQGAGDEPEGLWPPCAVS
ncbi:hypothetical protein EDD15DRAFT_2577201 [Pisolithus albus]|nr:hypothetical protein EDD15DRAFT_2577201 [Pisolithus albus]